MVLVILMSGLTHHHVAQAAGFFKLQQLFNPSITGFYKKYMASLKTSGAKIVAVDTRFDSPGSTFIYILMKLRNQHVCMNFNIYIYDLVPKGAHARGYALQLKIKHC